MNIPQTNYNMYFNSAILGMQAIAGEFSRKISRTAAGIVYYGRAVIKSRLHNSVCRLPRQNKFTITADGGTLATALSNIITVITYGKRKNGEIAAVTTTKTITTAVTSKAATLTAHAAAIAAAMSDCYSCTYSSSGNGIITYIGDCDDIISVVTTVDSAYDTVTFTYAYSTQDAVRDILGISYLTHNRQQQIDGITYFMDTEPVNIMAVGTTWVLAEQLVKPATAPYARFLSDDSAAFAGYFGDSTISTNGVALAGAEFLVDAAAAALVPLTVNLPQ
jgi:hypothetical protein